MRFWRAGCGKSACPVRGGESKSRFQASLSLLLYRETPTSRPIAATTRALSTPILKKFSWRPWRLCERPQPASQSPQQQEPSALPYSKSFLGDPGDFARDPSLSLLTTKSRIPQTVSPHTEPSRLPAINSSNPFHKDNLSAKYCGDPLRSLTIKHYTCFRGLPY